MNQFPMDFLVFTTIATVLLMFLVYWRFTHPFHCTCGYQTIFARRMFRHLQISHKYVEKEAK